MHYQNACGHWCCMLGRGLACGNDDARDHSRLQPPLYATCMQGPYANYVRAVGGSGGSYHTRWQDGVVAEGVESGAIVAFVALAAVGRSRESGKSPCAVRRICRRVMADAEYATGSPTHVCLDAYICMCVCRLSLPSRVPGSGRAVMPSWDRTTPHARHQHPRSVRIRSTGCTRPRTHPHIEVDE